MNNQYTVYHLHSDYSLLDSCTKFTDYVDKARELGQTAIASTEHGNIYNWIAKKMYCDKTQYICQDCGKIIDKNVTECTDCKSTNLKQTIKPIKYIHGCEVYLTEKFFHTRNNKDNGEEEQYKVRDNYHTVLLAKNMDGLKELNSLVSSSSETDHFYYKPRISFDDFFFIF